VQRFFYVVFVHDDGRKGGAPKGATGGVWRQVTSGFYPRVPLHLYDIMGEVADRYGTQAKLVRTDYDAGTVETIRVFGAAPGKAR